MSEETAFDQMAEDLITRLGVDATYLPGIGESVSLKVNFDQEVDYQPDTYDGNVQGYVKTIEFLYSDIGALPVAGDVFIIGDDRYNVKKINDHDGAGRFVKVIVN
jgi:hypothetical protein